MHQRGSIRIGKPHRPATSTRHVVLLDLATSNVNEGRQHLIEGTALLLHPQCHCSMDCHLLRKYTAPLNSSARRTWPTLHEKVLKCSHKKAPLFAKRLVVGYMCGTLALPVYVRHRIANLACQDFIFALPPLWASAAVGEHSWTAIVSVIILLLTCCVGF